MQKVSAFSVLFTKVLFLSCLSFMGLFNGDVFAAKVPCYEMVMASTEEEPDCEACEMSEETWSQAFLAATKVETKNIEVLMSVSTEFSDLLSKEATFIRDLSAPDPPPDGFRTLWLEAKEKIVLVI